MVIIYISFADLESLMIKSKLKDNQTYGSGEEDY